MSDNSAIEWTDATWSPTTGCDRVSDGCDHCYALTMAKRLKAMGKADYQLDGDPLTSGPGFGVAAHEHRLTLPLQWRKPRLVFVNSMSDLFHSGVPDEFIARVFAVMALAGQHTFQVLTKRHARMRVLLADEDFRRAVDAAVVPLFAHLRPPAQPRHLDLDHGGVVWPLPNVWLGASVEDQRWANLRIPALLHTPAAVRFLSCEPLLGPVDLSRWTQPHAVYCQDANGDPPWCTCGRDSDGYLDWVIIGGESGPGARPMHLSWVRGLVEQCTNAQVPVFVKQMGKVLGRELGCADHKGHDIEAWPEDLRRREFPTTAAAA